MTITKKIKKADANKAIDDATNKRLLLAGVSLPKGVKPPKLTDEQKIAALRAQREAARQERQKITSEISVRQNKIDTLLRPMKRKAEAVQNASRREMNKKLDAVRRQRDKEVGELRKKIAVVNTALDPKFAAARHAHNIVYVKTNAEVDKAHAKLANSGPVQTKSLRVRRSKLYEMEAKIDTQIARIDHAAKIPPKKGVGFTFYKKLYEHSVRYGARPIICTMEVSPKAERLCGDHHRFKSRVSAAKVIKLEWQTPKEGEAHPTKARSGYDFNFTYEVGKIVRPKNGKFDKNRNDICSVGIHGYMLRAGAESHS